MKYLTIKHAAVGLIAAACVALPVAGIASASTSAPADNAPVTTNSKKYDLDTAKAKADAAVQKRLASITVLDGRLQGVQHAECQAAAMTSQLAADSSGLTSLQAQIDALPAGTTVAQFRALSDQIALNYRIYMLQTPKTRVVVACDKVFSAADKLDAVAAKIQSKNPSADVSAIKADAQAARDDATKAVNDTINLVPDQGNGAAQAANKAALLQARSDIKSAVASLKDGRSAAKALKV